MNWIGSTRTRYHAPYRRVALLLTCLLVTCFTSGCNILGAAAYLAVGDEKEVRYESQYRGLEKKNGAVLVVASPEVLRRYPQAVKHVCSAVTLRLAKEIPGAKFVAPKQVLIYQDKHPYWNTVPYGTLIKQLNVDRIVYVDLSRYQTFELDNPHMLQGKITAGIGVVEAEAANPDKFSFYTQVNGQYPEDTPIGLTSAEHHTIEMATVARFSKNVENLFLDHTKIEKR